jgi:hypothetical protein
MPLTLVQSSPLLADLFAEVAISLDGAFETATKAGNQNAYFQYPWKTKAYR